MDVDMIDANLQPEEPTNSMTTLSSTSTTTTTSSNHPPMPNSKRLLLLRKQFCPQSMLLPDGSINQELRPSLPSSLLLSPPPKHTRTRTHTHTQKTKTHSYLQPKELSSKWSDIEYLCLIEGIKEFGMGGMKSWIKISEKWLPQRDFAEIKLRISQIVGKQNLSIYESHQFTSEFELKCEYRKNKKLAMELRVGHPSPPPFSLSLFCLF